MARNAIVLMIDRLGSGFVGPYGNTWVETPALNRLASESLLFETVIGDSTRLEQLYDSYWLGTHAVERVCGSRLQTGAGRRQTGPAESELAAPRYASVAVPPETKSGVGKRPLGNAGAVEPATPSGDVVGPPEPLSLLCRLAEAGVTPLVMTDSEQVASHRLAAGFCEALLPGNRPLATAQAVDQTRTAELLAAALERAQELRSPFLLWVHAAAMNAVWDAPYEYRASLADEEDPEPPSICEPPHRELGETYDPDELLGIVQSYAGEVVALDELLGALLEAIEEAGLAPDTLVVLAAPRGYPLGEHGFVGAAGDQLHTELLETPLLIRDPRQRHSSLRLLDIVQPADLFATLLDWFQLLPQPAAEARSAAENTASASSASPTVSLVPAPAPLDEPAWTASRGQSQSPVSGVESPQASSVGPGQSLLMLAEQSPWTRSLALSLDESAWALRTPEWFLLHTKDGHDWLYAKPDDRWEVNEVADRCRQVVDQLKALALQLFATQGVHSTPTEG